MLPVRPRVKARVRVRLLEVSCWIWLTGQLCGLKRARLRKARLGGAGLTQQSSCGLSQQLLEEGRHVFPIVNNLSPPGLFLFLLTMQCNSHSVKNLY